MRKQSVLPDGRRRSPVATVTKPPLPQPQLECTPDDTVLHSPHQLEQEIRHRLMSEPNLTFSSLVVRRMQGGVCLEGVVETDDDSTDIERIVRRVAAVERVLNYLVVRRAHQPPPKG